MEENRFHRCTQIALKEQGTRNKEQRNKMTSIQKTLSQGEGLTVEFKRAKGQLPSSLFETVCAFLNRSGGTILLGVGDDKSIEGVDPDKAETLCKNIATLSNNPQKLFPAFLLTAKKVEFRGKTLIHLFVPISSQVHRCNNKIFDRSEDGDFELKTNEQIKQLYNRKSIHYTENKIYPYLTEDHFAAGVKNVFKYSKAYSGSDNVVFEENDVFIAKVPLGEAYANKNRQSDKNGEGLNEGLSEGLSEGLTSILDAINKNPGIQARDLSTLLDNRPIKTIERQISALTKRKLIERRGSKKTGGYFSAKQVGGK